MPRYTDIDKLIAEYDRVHVGPAGGARKLMVEAPIADVAPRAEVVDEIFKDILNIIREYSHSACIVKNNYGMTQAEYIGTDILKLKKKYTEGQK